jgi:hypothetical protein
VGDFAKSEEKSASLIKEKAVVWTDEKMTLPRRQEGDFLFCRTDCTRFENEWRKLAAKLQNPQGDPNVAKVIDLFAGMGR